MLTLFFLLIDGFILTQVYSQKDKKEFFDEKRVELEGEIERTEKAIEFIHKQARLGHHVQSDNVILKDSIHNLFALVPDQIHLTRAEIERNSLVLYGFTPNKAIYNSMLMPPLKSIFTETTVAFYPLGNGWYRFVSKNRSKEDLLYEKH